MFMKTYVELVKMLTADLFNFSFVKMIFTQPRDAVLVTFKKRTPYQWLFFKASLVNLINAFVCFMATHLLFYQKEVNSARYRAMFDLTMFDREVTERTIKYFSINLLVHLGTWFTMVVKRTHRSFWVLSLNLISGLYL